MDNSWTEQGRICKLNLSNTIWIQSLRNFLTTQLTMINQSHLHSIHLISLPSLPLSLFFPHSSVDQFAELRGLGGDSLMYIKEDLIIPHTYSFYDLIVTKARGKSGPLFSFDVHDDVRMTIDASIEKDESHAGKIVTKAYYERNKNNFPASRWEVFDPTIVREKYSIKGGEVRGAFAPK